MNRTKSTNAGALPPVADMSIDSTAVIVSSYSASALDSRRSERTARSGVLDGAGLIYDEHNSISNFIQLSDAHAEAQRHAQLRLSELRKWTSVDKIKERVEKATSDEGKPSGTSHQHCIGVLYLNSV